MPKKREPAAEVTVDRIDHARLTANNGVTFFAKFNKRTKACQVSIGRDVPADSGFVVSFEAMRAFTNLVRKYIGKGA